MALCAEFLGSMLFSFTGSALLSVALASPTDPNVVMAALGNAAGITVAGTHITRATHAQAEHAEPAQLRSSLLPYKLSKRTRIFVFTVVLYDVVQPSSDRLNLPLVTPHSNRSIFDAPEVVVHHRRVSLQCTALLTSLAVTSPLLSLSERWSVDISALSKVRYWCARRINTDHLLASTCWISNALAAMCICSLSVCLTYTGTQLTLATWGVADDADKACICLVTLSAMYAPV